ncbi:hypothetical protein BHE74_00012700 [Ensete ventricosum]|nr:hypothetical protein BHE74_00012700 [Ensete ventricosum]RZS12837.1 hypothetical protein BHM03_00044341 [Ensete ventricosum]
MSPASSSDLARLTKAHLLDVLAELQRQNQWRLTLKAFGTDRREPWYRHDLALCAEMITTLARCIVRDEIDAVVTDLLQGDEGWISSEDTKGISRLVRPLMVAEKGVLV